MKLFIKNMACIRCMKVVENELKNLGFQDFTMHAGEAEIRDELSGDQLEVFKHSINKLGLELIDDKTSIIVEKIKDAIREQVYRCEEAPKSNFSEHLSQKLGYDYKHLSKLFSTSEGISIEKRLIKQRIERVKELLIYTDSSLNEISYKLHYSSVAHLSGQFKKETGLTPSYFRKINNKLQNKAPDQFPGIKQ